MERTCGNCGNSKQTNVYCQISDGLTAGLHSLDERACKHWVERFDSLEQRCQQLEQVAREMYRELESVTDRRLERRTRDDLLSVYFGKLYDLGVSLDD